MQAQLQLLVELQTRQVEQQELLLQQQARSLLMLEQLLVQQLTRQDLLEALRPVALAMQRQDSLHSQRQEETKELLLEVLNSLQPPVEDQIFQRIGHPPQRSISRSSVS
jgi:hypothetical protein